MSEKKIVHLHCHDMMSNDSMFESIASIDDYIKRAKEYGNIPAISVSNHGNVVNYIEKKQACDKNGFKYLHSIEIYATDDNNDSPSLSRDNFHLLLIAKNLQGVKEINVLSSNSFNRKDNHFYYKPRVFFDEIEQISDNVIILTACLGSPLWQHYKNKDNERFNKWLKFFVSNKDNVYLEVQPHIHDEQKEYNKLLLDIAKENGMNIVATNDVHNLDDEHSRIAKMIKESKGIVFDTDDDFETTFKSRDEMHEMFVKQGVLSNGDIEIALDNTVNVADRVEHFEFDRSIKYPQMFDSHEQSLGSFNLNEFRDKPFSDSIDLFKHLIVMGYQDRGIDKLPSEEQKRYKEQVNYELDVYIKTKSIDYMLLEYTVKKEARDKIIDPDNAIYPGFSRGSVGGSLIAYLLRIIDINPIKYDLVFERFMSEDRIGNPDIDSDWYRPDRNKVQMHLLHDEKMSSASIMTQGTLQTKGSAKTIGKALGYSAVEMNNISKAMDLAGGEVTNELREQYKDIFELSDKVDGSVSHFSRHASAIVIATEDIKETLGLMTSKDWDGWITQQNMGSVDYLNYVKLDVLGLDNVGLLNLTSDMCGLPRLTPDTDFIDFEDDKIWEAVRDDNTGIFQFESDRGGKILSKILSKENVENQKKRDKNFKYINLISLASAGMRPSGASYIEEVTNGEFNDNGHPVLDDFLAETQGFLVYQEQQMSWLVEFAKFDKREADTVRKGIAKKKPEIMERELPKIKPAFMNTMITEYGLSEDEASLIADRFLTIFMDSMDYSFGKNHSIGYALISGVSAWLRYYYPLEFLATALEIWQKTDKEVEFLKYADKHNIEIMPPKFRKSTGKYFGNQEDGKIYQGTAHIKGGNASVGDALYTLKDYQYKTFTDLIIDVIENARVIRFDKEDQSEMFDMTIQDFYRTYSEDRVKEFDKLIKANPNFITYDNSPLSINRTKIEGLIKLNFFEEFGQNKKLQQVYDYVMANYNPKNKTFANKQKKYLACLEYEASLEDERFSILEQCEFELFYTGRVTTKSETIPAKYAFVTKIENVGKTRTTADVFIINKGISTQIKVGSKLYKNVTFEVGDLIEVLEKEVKAKEGYVGGVWTKSPTDRELWIKQMKMIRRSKMTDGKKEKK